MRLERRAVQPHITLAILILDQVINMLLPEMI